MSLFNGDEIKKIVRETGKEVFLHVPGDAW